MAEAAAPPSGGKSPLKMITQKVGPLPVWAYAAVLVLAYFLYRRSHPSGSSTGGTPSGGPATTDQAYVPGFDAAGAGGGGGIGSVGTPGVVNNYYYGDLAAQQANGGGTSATPVGQTPGPVRASVGIGYSGPGGGGVTTPIVQPQRSPSYYVPPSTQVAGHFGPPGTFQAI